MTTTKDTAPWVWQATGLFDRMKDGSLSIVELAADLQHEYERGKTHGADDRKMIERHNRDQGHEIDRLKGRISRIAIESARRNIEVVR